MDFSGLKALLLNCTLKPTGRLSNIDALMQVPKEIMQCVTQKKGATR
ncbi:hypothetical protein ATI45_2893 [Marinobacter sp. LV10MA510-1]|nr:hypothetical protein ATI45_2893 [Marinobacter sp. LV10MA510-1]PFG52354.1 hypothetical protein ATG98_1369 [Marinobacter sp. LV10R520-4]